jgi:tRNA-dihydrouridine synthase B
MARITDAAFRSMCVKNGAQYTVTELINAHGLLQNPDRVKEQCIKADNEKNFAIQLFGHDAQMMAQAAKMVEPYCDVIDINLGCPAYKICNVGAGSQLMKTPEKIASIVKAMDKAVDIPITTKMRLGTHAQDITVHKVAKACEEAGSTMVMIHGRTRSQGYAGEANWDIIKEVKEELTIPVTGNGDVNNPEVCKERFDKYGVDAIGIGRAASGNPLIFKEIKEYMDTGKYHEHSTKEQLNCFAEYLELSKEYELSMLHQKIQAQHFTKGIRGGNEVRKKLSSIKTTENLLATVSECLENVEE